MNIETFVLTIFCISGINTIFRILILVLGQLLNKTQENPVAYMFDTIIVIAIAIWAFLILTTNGSCL